MTVDRRRFLLGAAQAGALMTLPAAAGAAEGASPPVADNGLFTQPWFMQTFLDLREDHSNLTGSGKSYAVLFEQRGCPYCREMHRVNFARKEITDYITANYGILQLDMWGSHKVKDFDGKEMEERALARRWRVSFTPTMVFFPRDVEAVAGKSGFDAEIFRMPGYFKPFHFISMLEYVHEGQYAKLDFQRYLQARFADLRAKGIEPDVW
ncbi:MAG: thioredoxin family protein [Hyphomicrobiales bacterium]